VVGVLDECEKSPVVVLHAGSAAGLAARGLGLGLEPRVEGGEEDGQQRQETSAPPLPVRGTRRRPGRRPRPQVGHHDLRQAAQTKEDQSVGQKVILLKNQHRYEYLILFLDFVRFLEEFKSNFIIILLLDNTKLNKPIFFNPKAYLCCVFTFVKSKNALKEDKQIWPKCQI